MYCTWSGRLLCGHGVQERQLLHGDVRPVHGGARALRGGAWRAGDRPVSPPHVTVPCHCPMSLPHVTVPMSLPHVTAPCHCPMSLSHVTP
eukprot:2572833-Prymnesium_polylepis.1